MSTFLACGYLHCFIILNSNLAVRKGQYCHYNLLEEVNRQNGFSLPGSCEGPLWGYYGYTLQERALIIRVQSGTPGTLYLGLEGQQIRSFLPLHSPRASLQLPGPSKSNLSGRQVPGTWASGLAGETPSAYAQDEASPAKWRQESGPGSRARRLRLKAARAAGTLCCFHLAWYPLHQGHSWLP